MFMESNLRIIKKDRRILHIIQFLLDIIKCFKVIKSLSCQIFFFKNLVSHVMVFSWLQKGNVACYILTVPIGQCGKTLSCYGFFAFETDFLSVPADND